MAINNFKPFALDPNANVTSQADWEALPALLSGFTAGKASSAQVNKAIRQASFIAAALAQYTANKSGLDVLDDGDLNGFISKMGTAFGKDFQALDATLSALAGLATGANKLPYFTGNDTAAQTDLTSVGRDIIGKNTIADILTYLDLGDVLHAGKNLYEIAEKGAAHQASARDNLALNAIAAIVGGTNKLPYFVDINTAELADFTAFAKTLLSRTDASAVRGDLGLKSAALREVGVGENQIPDISSFANSPHQNGFMKLPGGLMLQWGLGVGVNGTASVTFNQAFVNRPFFVGFGYKQSTFPSAMQSIIINDEYFDNTAFSARTLMFDGTAIAASPNAFLWYALGV